MEIFKDCDILNIKDISKTNTRKLPTHLIKIFVNNREMTVKKSKLCWLFISISGRLSSDRLLRVRTDSARALIVSKKCMNSKRNVNLEQSDTSVSGSCRTDSEFENESFSDKNDEETDIAKRITVNKDEYYAVLYDKWYIGLVIETLDENTSKIKFLKRELDEYMWHRPEDIQILNNKYIFYGPIKLNGIGPFLLKSLKLQKKCLNNKLFRIIFRILLSFPQILKC